METELYNNHEYVFGENPENEIKSLDVNRTFNEHGYEDTILSRAARTLNIKLIKLLLKHPKIDVNKRDKEGRTPFFDACTHNALVPVTTLLADNRVDIEMPTYNGKTPFFSACDLNSDTVIMHLLLYTNIKMTPHDEKKPIRCHFNSRQYSRGKIMD